MWPLWILDKSCSFCPKLEWFSHWCLMRKMMILSLSTFTQECLFPAIFTWGTSRFSICYCYLFTIFIPLPSSSLFLSLLAHTYTHLHRRELLSFFILSKNMPPDTSGYYQSNQTHFWGNGRPHMHSLSSKTLSSYSDRFYWYIRSSYSCSTILYW